MIQEYNERSFIWGGPGILLQIGGRVAMAMTTDLLIGLLGLLAALVGTVLLIIGLGYYAKAKGYGLAFGLFGLLSLLGLLILALLPDKTKGQPAA